MKNLFRSVVFVLLVGGWTLASAAVHVVRTPGSVVVLTKNQLCFHDTYVDTRAWTISDDRAHPALVSRFVALKKSDALAHTVDPKLGPVEVQLAAAAALPTTKPPGDIIDTTKADLKSVGDTIKSKVN